MRPCTINWLYVYINSHGNSPGGLKTTLKGFIYQELSSEVVTQIEKTTRVAQKKMEEMLETLENNKSF